MTDTEIEILLRKAGGSWQEYSFWRIEDADLYPFARALLAAERDRCAQYLRDEAERLAPEGKRINQVDRHCARVLATMGDELALRPNVM
jgi:hypothetical protein